MGNNKMQIYITIICLLCVIISLSACRPSLSKDVSSSEESLESSFVDEFSGTMSTISESGVIPDSIGSSSASVKTSTVKSSNGDSTPTGGNSSSSTVSEANNKDTRNFDFNGPISKEVLNNFLSKAVTHNGFAAFAGYGNVPAGGNPDFLEDFRMIKNIGAMYIGRAAHVWGFADEEEHYKESARIAKLVHDYNSKIILEAAVFEAVYKDNVNIIPVPAWVFTEFGLPVQTRNFIYSDMLYSDGQFVNQWGTNASVPDLTRLESQMWFYYRCARYIDSGYEAIHLGQLAIMTRRDSGKLITAGLIDRIRNYATAHARRKWVILAAHIYSKSESTYQKNGKTYLLLDFHAFPLRPRDNFAGSVTASDGYQPAMLEKNFIDSIYGRSAGGINPSGWETDYNPFLCEFDNSGFDQSTKDQNLGKFWPWGYDEITWFSKQPPNRRSEILINFYAWIKTNYTYGNMQMPTRVPLAFPFTVYFESEEYGKTAFNNIHFFKANTQSATSLVSFNLERTIKNLWKNP